MAKKAKKKTAKKAQGKRSMVKSFTVEIQTVVHFDPEYRITFTSGHPDKLKEAIVSAENEAQAIRKFYEDRSSYKIRTISELPNVEKLKMELADAKAKLKELQKRKNPASRKKAKTSKKS